MIIHIPDPVVLRVQAVESNCVAFEIRDACQHDAFAALLQQAVKHGFAVQLSLVHYEGQPDMIEQAKARKARKES
jgi:hypothetical protein